MSRELTFERNVHSYEDEDGTNYWFEGAMCSGYPDLFGHLDSNCDVERVLEKAKVIDKFDGCEADSESCALVVNFKTRADARCFISRLNRFIRTAQDKVAAARRGE